MKKIVLYLFISTLIVFAQNKIKVGIDEQLGKNIPLDVTFKDEAGNDVVLKSLFTKPTILTFVYFDCPGICTPLMNSMAEVVDLTDLKGARDYNIVSISMDHSETPQLAADKKRNYMKMIQRADFPETAWRFLTGDSASVHRVTDAAGFYFMKEGKEFIHTGALIFVTPEGKISRYLIPNYSQRSGYNILPFDFKMALTETSEGKLVPTAAKMLQYCFSYDPEGKTYVLNFTRIIGAGILVIVLVFVVVISVKPKKKKNQLNEEKVNGSNK